VATMGVIVHTRLLARGPGSVVEVMPNRELRLPPWCLAFGSRMTPFDRVDQNIVFVNIQYPREGLLVAYMRQDVDAGPRERIMKEFWV
jgi:hypothetical protein